MDHKTAARGNFEAVEPELRAISRWMYDNPELALREHRSAARLAAFLEANGLETTLPVYGLDTAFEATAGSEGPEVVICAEYDALPEIGHACGHNIIATAALGAGVALAPLTDELGFRVRVLGTPAEEDYGGKVDLIRAGAFEGVAAAMMIHPAPYDISDPYCLAITHMEVEFFGKESHASSKPQVGINALDAAVQAYVNVSTLRQALYATDKVHGIITYGGGAPNVIPPYTSMAWYVRALTLDRLNEVKERVVACFEAAAAATGCTFKLTEPGNLYTDLRSDPVLADLFTHNAGDLGRRMGRTPDRDPSLAGSTDMGNVSHEVPTIHPMLSIDSGPAVNHQREFAAATITPAGDRAIRDGAVAMAWTVIDMAREDLWGRLTKPG